MRNKNKHKECKRIWYQKNKEKVDYLNNLRKQKLAEWFVDYKSRLRCDCGENHPGCLEFHHKSDEKDINVSRMVHFGYSKERILKEIAKCEVKCSNCHQKIHWNHKGKTHAL